MKCHCVPPPAAPAVAPLLHRLLHHLSACRSLFEMIVRRHQIVGIGERFYAAMLAHDEELRLQRAKIHCSQLEGIRFG
ncbi:MAG: hypothetical protein ACYC0X_33280 [Pirellulaceae bacterium]